MQFAYRVLYALCILLWIMSSLAFGCHVFFFLIFQSVLIGDLNNLPVESQAECFLKIVYNAQHVNNYF